MNQLVVISLFILSLSPLSSEAASKSCIGNFTDQEIEWTIYDKETGELEHYTSKHPANMTWKCIQIEDSEVENLKITLEDEDEDTLRSCVASLAPNEWVEVRESDENDGLECLHYKDAASEVALQDVSYQQEKLVPMVNILGRVFLDKPIVGATLTIYNGDNEEVKTFKNKTNKLGVFSIDMEFTVKDLYKIVVSDGEYGKNDLIGTLEAKLSIEKEGVKTVNINAISSFISTYSDFEGLSIADATKKVKSFLDIPTYFDTKSYTPVNSEKHFSHYAFSKELRKENIPVDQFIDETIKEFGTSKHSFKSRLLKAFPKTPSELGTWAIEKMAGAVISKITGKTFDSIFGGGDTSSQLADIRNQINALSNQMKQLQDAVLKKLDKSTYASPTRDFMKSIIDLEGVLEQIQSMTDDIDNPKRDEKLMVLAEQLIKDNYTVPDNILNAIKSQTSEGQYDVASLNYLYASFTFPTFPKERYLGPRYYYRVEANLKYFKMLATKAAVAVALTQVSIAKTKKGQEQAKTYLEKRMKAINATKVSVYAETKLSFKNPGVGKNYIVDLYPHPKTNSNRIWANFLGKKANIFGAQREMTTKDYHFNLTWWIPTWQEMYDFLWLPWYNRYNSNPKRISFPKHLKDNVGFTVIPKELEANETNFFLFPQDRYYIYDRSTCVRAGNCRYTFVTVLTGVNRYSTSKFWLGLNEYGNSSIKRLNTTFKSQYFKMALIPIGTDLRNF